jgi:hypothetical protein
MNSGRLIFTQVTALIHREQFNRSMELHPMPSAAGSSSWQKASGMRTGNEPQKAAQAPALVKSLSFCFYY